MTASTSIKYVERTARSQRPSSGEPFHKWMAPNGCVWAEFSRFADRYLVRFPELADFEISADGTQTCGRKVPGISASTMEHLYLNQVVPLSLSCQGKLVLHAGAVEINTVGVAFVGPSGRGKSTLTASFAKSGYRFLTDDGLQIDLAEGRAEMLPSHPSIRLWADSESFLMASQEKAAPVCYTNKSKFVAGEDLRYCDKPRTLRRVYFLGDDGADHVTIEPVAATKAMLALLKHSFVLDIEAQDLLAAQFNALSSLAALPIFFTLDYPRRFECLPMVREAIVRHAMSLDSPA